MYIKTIITIVVLFVNYANAQQIIRPNIKHDWEDGRYIVNANNTITDTKTTLIWKKCIQGLSGSNCTTSTSPTVHNWQDALDIADTSIFAGFTDWRLPNIKELRSIVAYDRHSPAINSVVFPNTPPSVVFWSSSPSTMSSSDTLLMHFQRGYIGSANGGINYYYVRLVRGGL